MKRRSCNIQLKFSTIKIYYVEYPFIVSINLLASMNACFSAVSTMAISMPWSVQEILPLSYVSLVSTGSARKQYPDEGSMLAAGH